MPNALPVRRLDSVEWETACILGSPLTEIDADPQKHCAVRVMDWSPGAYNVQSSAEAPNNMAVYRQC
jgi:hypothetical protein